MRSIGFDIHLALAKAVALEDGKLRRLGLVAMRGNFVAAVAATLSREDIVVVAATGNAAAVAGAIGPPCEAGGDRQSHKASHDRPRQN